MISRNLTRTGLFCERRITETGQECWDESQSAEVALFLTNKETAQKKKILFHGNTAAPHSVVSPNSTHIHCSTLHCGVSVSLISTTSTAAPHNVQSRCPPFPPTSTASLQTKASFSYFTPSSLGNCVKAAVFPEWSLDINRIGKHYKLPLDYSDVQYQAMQTQSEMPYGLR